jgi:MscS family membrane protein
MFTYTDSTWVERVAAALCLFSVLFVFVTSPYPALAQTPTVKDVIERDKSGGTSEDEAISQAKKKPIAPPRPADDLGRTTPRTAVLGFFRVVDDGDLEQASEFLDLRNLPGTLSQDDGPELARQLKVVLDQALWVDVEALSTDLKGHTDDNLASNLDWIGRINVDQEQIDILLQRVPDSTGSLIWKFSRKTVVQIPRLYNTHGYGPIGERLSLLLPNYEFLGLKIWQWVMLAGLLMVSYGIAIVLTSVAAMVIRHRDSGFRSSLAALTTGPVRFLIMLLLAKNWFESISPSVTARAIIESKTLIIIVVTWVVVRVVEIIRRDLSAKMEVRSKSQAGVLLRPTANVVKIIIIIIASMIWFENLGFKASTLLAGLGIGGLAVALAAQKSLENLIAAVTLYTAAPVRVGDFCRYGDKLGVIDEIGLRFSRIRTLDRTVVKVPNATLADMHLENFMERDKIWYHPQVRLRYDATPDQIRSVLDEVGQMLRAHPKVDPNPARIRFSGFGSHSLDLDIFAYILTQDFEEYLELAQELNLRIMDIVANAGCTLAVPTQTLWMERGRGPIKGNPGEV